MTSKQPAADEWAAAFSRTSATGGSRRRRFQTSQTDVKLFRGPLTFNLRQQVLKTTSSCRRPARRPRLEPYKAMGAGLLIPANQDLPAPALVVRLEKCFRPGLECRCGLAECREKGHPLKPQGENSGIISRESAISFREKKKRKKNLLANGEPVASTLCRVCRHSDAAWCGCLLVDGCSNMGLQLCLHRNPLKYKRAANAQSGF